MTDQKEEIYSAEVNLRSGEVLEGYVRRGGDVEGFWVKISRTPDMLNATYINRSEISYFNLYET